MTPNLLTPNLRIRTLCAGLAGVMVIAPSASAQQRSTTSVTDLGPQ